MFASSLLWVAYNIDLFFDFIFRNSENKEACNESNLVCETYDKTFTDIQLQSGTGYYYYIRAVNNLTKVKSPFAPKTVEEITDDLKLDVIDVEKTNEIEFQEKYIKDLIEDIKTAIKLSKIEKPTKVYVYTAPRWMWKIAEKLKETKNIKEIMSDPEVREQGSRAIKVIKRLMKENIFDYFDEEKILLENKEFFKREFSIELVINLEENIGNKKDVAIPTKPGIAVI